MKLYPAAIALARLSEIGPITTIVAGTMIKRHIKGVPKALITSGSIF